jgi:hypothetical protein
VSERKLIVCLANSRKHLGRCVAGIELEGSTPVGWIRPVSSRTGSEVSETERQYEDGTDPKVLDILSVPLAAHIGEGYQSENWLLDPDQYWVRAGKATWDDLKALEDEPVPLWPSQSSDTYAGLNDRLTVEEIEYIDHSLRLIRVDELRINVFAPGSAWGNPKRRVQGKFVYLGTEYWVWITDPIIERRFLAQADGTYSLGECYVTMSLSEPHDGYSYKMIAAVIERDFPQRSDG